MLEKVGVWVRQRTETVPYVLGYVGRMFSSAAFFISREKAARKILIMQLLFTFIEALPIIVLLSLALGTGLYLVAYSFLLSIGQSALIYKLLVIIMSRELGPILIAFVVTARSATAIATEIGGMVTSHEIEAYISVGVDPIDHLGAPRFLGVTGSMFFLNLYFSFCGLLAPAVIIQFVNPVPFAEYFSGLFEEFTIRIIIVSLVKSIFFGMIIATVSTYYGFAVERASTEVPVAGIQAVGKSILFVVLVDAFIT